MIVKRMALIVMAGMVLLGYRSEAQVGWANKAVGLLELPDPTHNCIFFTLFDIVEADPAFPGSPWMAIPASQTGFQQMFALLLAAKIQGGNVGVRTSGAAATGCTALNSATPVVGVTYIYLQ